MNGTVVAGGGGPGELLLPAFRASIGRRWLQSDSLRSGVVWKFDQRSDLTEARPFFGHLGTAVAQLPCTGILPTAQAGQLKTKT
jgi:hypothetical protein